MKTTYKPREYNTIWWKQKAAAHQSAAHLAIANLESAITSLKTLRDEPAMERLGTSEVTNAGYAMKRIMIALEQIWPHVVPTDVPPAEPGIYAELLGAEFYRRILDGLENSKETK